MTHVSLYVWFLSNLEVATQIYSGVPTIKPQNSTYKPLVFMSKI